MALLEVKNVSRHFGGLKAVAEVSFEVRKGEILGLIGPNGAGKTTVFNLVTGFLRPTAGEILLDGEAVTRLKPHALNRRGVARTFQIVKPFVRLSVRENVALAAMGRLPRRAEAEEEAAKWVREVGLGARLDAPASELTLGDQKRLEMARALATAPRLLLLDEPLGGLNSGEIDEAAELVRRIRDRGVTIVLVEHVMKAIMRISDRVIVMNQGRKIAEGAPQEVVRDPAVVTAYLGHRAA